MGTRLARVGIAFAVYSGLVLWLTWPLGARLATDLPNTWPGSRTDPLLVGWALAHESRALLRAPWTLADGGIFHPTPHSLFYGEAAFGALPVFLPVFMLSGNPTLALNVTFLGGVAATAAALHLVARRLAGSHAAGLVAGATFLTAPWVLWTWMPSAPNYALLPLLPVIALLAATPQPTAASALRLVPLVVMQGLASAYVAAATIAPLGALAAARLLRARTRRAGAYLGASLALATVVLLLAFAGHAVVRGENPSWAGEASLATLGPPVTRLPWGPLRPPAPAAVASPVLVLIAVGILARLVPGRTVPLDRAAWAPGILWTVVGLAIAVSPRAELWGWRLTLPQSVLAAWTPIYDVLRAPTRLALAALVGIALLAGTALAECARRVGLGARGRALLAALVVAATYASYRRGVMAPPVVAHVPLPSAYPLQRPLAAADPLLPLLARPGGPLLELPVGSGPVSHAQAMYRAIQHRRRILNGYSGYLPSGYRERLALACVLPDAAALATLRAQTGVELVLVDLARVGRAAFPSAAYRCPEQPEGRATEGRPAVRDAWLRAAAGDDPGFALVARDGERLLFRVRP